MNSFLGKSSSNKFTLFEMRAKIMVYKSLMLLVSLQKLLEIVADIVVTKAWVSKNKIVLSFQIRIHAGHVTDS